MCYEFFLWFFLLLWGKPAFYSQYTFANFLNLKPFTHCYNLWNFKCFSQSFIVLKILILSFNPAPPLTLLNLPSSLYDTIFKQLPHMCRCRCPTSTIYDAHFSTFLLTLHLLFFCVSFMPLDRYAILRGNPIFAHTQSNCSMSLHHWDSWNCLLFVLLYRMLNDQEREREKLTEVMSLYAWRSQEMKKKIEA